MIGKSIGRKIFMQKNREIKNPYGKAKTSKLKMLQEPVHGRHW
jgi:hypothetical protein